MIEPAPGIFYMPGDNQSLYPYCSGHYIKGRNLRVLIDGGMGPAQMTHIKKLGLDLFAAYPLPYGSPSFLAPNPRHTGFVS
jgi:hypothetical protein